MGVLIGDSVIPLNEETVLASNESNSRLEPTDKYPLPNLKIF